MSIMCTYKTYCHTSWKSVCLTVIYIYHVRVHEHLLRRRVVVIVRVHDNAGLPVSSMTAEQLSNVASL